jgi:DNA-binding NarL/FixJ family response regulator
MANRGPAGQHGADRPLLRIVPSVEKTAEAIHVVVVDDHPLLRDAVKIACENDRDIRVVGQAGSGTEALEVCARVKPDVLVIDVGLPGIDGLEVARRLKAQRSPIRILVLTGSEEPGSLFEARRIGVEAFVEKSAHIEELPGTIRKVAAGEWEFSSRQQQRANQQLAVLIRRARETKRVAASLTTRELDVLRLIADGATTRQTASRLKLSQRTIESHIAKLYSKLGARTRVQVVILASRLGLLVSNARSPGMPAPAALGEGGA